MSDYAKLKVAELQAQLKERSLPHTGKKDELIARLQENDASKNATVSAPAAAQEDEIDWDDDATAQPAPITETATDPATTSATEKVAEPLINETATNGAVDAAAESTTGESYLQNSKTSSTETNITDKSTPESAPAVQEPPTTEAKPEEPAAPPPPTEQEISAELEKRLARIDKYVNKSDPADVARAEEEKAKLLRLAKFKDTSTESASDIHNPKGMLDSVLPEKRERKRGRGEQDGERGGKRRRGGGGGGGGGERRNGGGEQRNGGGGRGGDRGNWMSDKDREAAKRRAERFAQPTA